MAVNIVVGLGSLDPLPLDLNSVDPLRLYAAPVDVSETIDSLVDHIMEMILRVDVLPVMPISEVILISDCLAKNFLTRLFNPAISLSSVSDCSVPLLESISAINIPRVIRHDDVVSVILWDEVLPGMPLKKTKSQRQTMDDLIDKIGLGDTAGLEMPDED
jgi:hypothetical protein